MKLPGELHTPVYEYALASDDGLFYWVVYNKVPRFYNSAVDRILEANQPK